MKKLVTICSLILVFTVTLYFREEIISFLVDNVSRLNNNSTKLENNEYASNNSFQYVQLTNNFKVKNQQDIKNVYYTIFNSGMEDFTFYCSNEYVNCITDVNYISNNQKLLSHINNFVPVFNTFKNVETEFDTLGKIHVHIIKTYANQDDIKKINDKVNEVIKEEIKNDQTDKEKIRAIHDYIINNSKYDSDRSDRRIINYRSDIAYGPLFEGYAICGGYADAMKLFLDKLGIPNFKISSENHVWNVVKIDGMWLHLDLTWDDPVTSTGEDVIDYDYFLVTSEELNKLENEQHTFDESIYLELKEKDA